MDILAGDRIKAKTIQFVIRPEIRADWKARVINVLMNLLAPEPDVRNSGQQTKISASQHGLALDFAKL